MEISSIKIENNPVFLRLGQLLLVFYILAIYQLPVVKLQIFLPFIPYFDHFRVYPFLGNLLYMILVISALFVILNYQSRFFITILGFGIFVMILADRTKFSNSLCFTSFLMILCGLYQEKIHWIFRVQIALLYFGAGLNKFLDPDWLNGQYFENFATQIFHVPFYKKLSGLLPDLLLSKILGWMTIAFELSFAMLFLCRIKLFETIFVAYIFHGIMLFMTSGKLSVLFFYLMGTSFLLLIEYPKNTIEVIYSKEIQFLFGIFKTMDWDYSFKWSECNSTTLNLTIHNKTYKGVSAWIRLIFLHKYLHFFGLVLFAVFRLVYFYYQVFF